MGVDGTSEAGYRQDGVGDIAFQWEDRAAVGHDKRKAYRIGIGGIAIESSTFSPLPSTIDDFTIQRGDEIVAGYSYFQDGTFEGRTDVEWLGTLKARSIPGGPIVSSDY